MKEKKFDYSDKTVLITGVGGLIGQGILRSLHAIENRPNIIATDIDLFAAGYYWADKSFVVPHSSDEDLYLNSIEEKCARNDVSVIFPGSDMEARLLVENNPNPDSIAVAASPIETWEIAGDKLELNELCCRLDIPHPETLIFTEENLNTLVDQNSLPIVIKQRIGAGSRGFRIIRTEEDLKEILKYQEREAYILQEYIPMKDNEYTVGAYFDVNESDEEPTTIAYRRKLYNGNTVNAVTSSSVVFNDPISKLASSLGIKGYANFQFIMKNGKPHLIDLNPRFSSSTSMSLCLGHNWVETYLENLLFEVAPEDFSYELGTIIVRYFADLILPSEKVLRINELLK